jgi:hypothetical protein
MKKTILFFCLVFTITIFCSCEKDSSDDPQTNTQGTGNFTSSGGPAYNATYIGTCTATPNSNFPSNINVGISNNSFANTFNIFNMPKQSSGTFSFTNNLNSASLHGILSLNNYAVTAMSNIGGSLTKTGSNTFTFNCTALDVLTNITYNITGSGHY